MGESDTRRSEHDRESMNRSNRTRKASQKLLRDRRAAVMTEYAVLLGTVCIGFATAIAALGPNLVANYEKSQGIILSPFP
jgi:Flp pilus assembly pilin Flp